MSPKRVIILAAVALVVYGVVAVWVLKNFELPEIHGASWFYLVAALAAYMGAMWCYGLLFRESVKQSGDEVAPWSAFKAALVGAGVARLIPAGGAITPVALAWAVRGETDRAAGPALRTVMLNYAGLLVMAGGGLLVARPREGSQIASVSLVFVAPFVLIAGIALMFGSGKLASLNRYLPRILRERLASSVVNHAPGLESQAYIWTRLALEGVSLWLVLEAFSLDINGFQVMASFAVSSLAGGLPGTPGGLGVTEVGLALILAAYGIPAAMTAVAIIVFRVISYWIPAALGFLAGGTTFLKSKEAEEAAEASR
ncbi:MAG TPA: lysylphosphatidylglycerol synthase transmembrane domain-containing protein [Acidimicrobiia bacterium]